MNRLLQRFTRKYNEGSQQDTQAKSKQIEPLSNSLQKNIKNLSALTGNSSDVVIRTFQGANSLPMAIVYISGLTDTVVINDHILNPIMSDAEVNEAQQRNSSDSLTVIKDQILTVSSTKTVSNIDELMSSLYSGSTVILAEGWDQGISANSAKWMQRGVEEPSSQSVIRGPKDGFTEDISTNIALLRRRIKSPNLWKIDRRIGNVTQTDVSVMYLKGTADDLVVNEVLRRLDRIEIDGILESGYLEEFIQDQTFTPFPTIINTERPDTVAGSILEGQVAVLVDGTPFVLVLPITFLKFFLASEDYYQRFDISSVLRILRFFAFTISMILPSLYIAITTFHQEMLPRTLLVSLAAQREGIPFPAFFEALLMELTFEVLREAGVRMPRAIGSAISIVGALVLGQAAVEAGLVSAAMVIVVAFTAISSFVVPAFNISIAARLIRFILMVLAGVLGLFGIMSGLFFLLLHMLSLRSFGVPYMAPIAPFIPSNLKDTVIRVPWWMMVTRPRLFAKNNYVRQQANLRPEPSDKEGKK
ncbi:spore germination protein [Paenibacillus sp. Soil750]|uniref:spore germination protein n=1 Tax=Paenibacillus sp. Soil750 TaxID=1736398 RepID=UPI000701F380|nr:spore germination protein [Paenibacillus sp. Soil750]KRE69708.1 spore gernimation protein KA [Paenibacillus sp. Soil750]